MTDILIIHNNNFHHQQFQKLEKLTIDGIDYDYDWAIFWPELFLSKFGNLKVLTIEDKEGVDDKFLHSLGAYCPQLRYVSYLS